MMNGHILGSAIARALHARADYFDEAHLRNLSYNVSEIAQLFTAIEGELVDIANTDLEQMARAVVTELGINAKIQAVKAVRDRTGSGLREAKLAVEVAIAEQNVRDAWDAANAALLALDNANRGVAFSKRAVIDSSRFNNVVNDAAKEPF